MEYLSALMQGEGFYIPIKHNDKSIIQLPLEDVINELKPLLENSEKKIIGQNIKFDKNILMKYGLKIASIKMIHHDDELCPRCFSYKT